MQFIPELRDYLGSFGKIYTVRSFRYTSSLTRVEDVGLCNRKLIRKVNSPIDLEPYVASSGFKLVSQWWARIAGMIPPTESKYLYEVTIRDAS